MKRILLIIGIFAFLSTFVQSQEFYHVLKTKGIIKVKKTGETLKPGSKIKSNQAIIFGDKQSVAIIMSRSKGRFVVKANPTTKKKDNYLEYMVEEAMNAFDTDKKRTSTRGSIDINNDVDLKNFFKQQPFLILGGKAKLKFNQTRFPMNDNTFFYVTYQYKGEEIAKMLDYKDDILQFSAETIFKVDDKSIDQANTKNFHFLYYDAVKEISQYDYPLSPIFPANKSLKEEVDVMVQLLKEDKVKDEKIAEEIKMYLIENYGIPNKENFKDWIKDNYKLEVDVD